MPLHVDDLVINFGDRRILDHVSLEVTAGKVLAVLGPSGTGKTTLLACIAGLITPDSGTVRIENQEITKLSRARRAKKRLEQIGFVYQGADLLPELSPVENVMLPGLLNGADPKTTHKRAEQLITELEIHTSATTTELSGGEAQRLALARALITKPTVLLADEPTGSLDAATRDEVMNLIMSRVRQDKLAAVVVTHDTRVAQRADRTLTLTPAKECRA